jgi:hypothetical protein
MSFLRELGQATVLSVAGVEPAIGETPRPILRAARGDAPPLAGSPK